MAIESISSASPIMSAHLVTQPSRPPETTPTAQESASQQNDARRVAASGSGASPATLTGPESPRSSIVAVPNDAEGSLQTASSQVSRAYQGGEPSASAMRSASEAYQAEASARNDLASQQQGNGTRNLDITA